jgi:hypothetical protein
MASLRSPAESDAKARAERTESRLKVATALLAFLGALATALGITAGLFVKKAGTANERVDTGQQQVQALASENAELKQRISELETQASSAPGPVVTSSNPSASLSTAAILHEGDATVPSGKGIDLDALATGPQWGMLGGGTNGMGMGMGKL